MIPAESELRSMGDYVITRSYDGGVYLAHAEAGYRPKTERPGHKYLLRLINDLGTRYLYTREQVQAYYNEQKNKIRDARSDKEYAKTDKPQAASAAGKTLTANASYGNPASKSRTRTATAVSPAAAGKETTSDSAQNRLANSSRKRNVTGQAGPIQKGQTVTKTEMDAILEREEPLMKKADETYANYVAARERYGKNSKEAKQAEEVHNQYVTEIGKLEDQWRKLREKNIESSERRQQLMAEEQQNRLANSSRKRNVTGQAGQIQKGKTVDEATAHQRSEKANAEYHDALASGDPEKIKAAAAVLIEALTAEINTEKEKQARAAGR